jgi:hypothetical protein
VKWRNIHPMLSSPWYEIMIISNILNKMKVPKPYECPSTYICTSVVRLFHLCQVLFSRALSCSFDTPYGEKPGLLSVPTRWRCVLHWRHWNYLLTLKLPKQLLLLLVKREAILINKELSEWHLRQVWGREVSDFWSVSISWGDRMSERKS